VKGAALSTVEKGQAAWHHHQMDVERPQDISSKVKVDDSRWPVVIITQQIEQLTDAERIASLELSNQVLGSHGNAPYALVLDNRKAGPMPATQRKLIAEYMEKNALRARARCACTAFVSESVVMRAMLTAIMWLRKPEVETETFGDLNAAIAWGQRKLNERTGPGFRIRSKAP